MTISPFSATWRTDIARFLKSTFGNGSLEQIANLTRSPNQALYTNAAGDFDFTPLTPFARALLDDADAGEAWTTIGGGSGGTTYSRLPDGTMLQQGSAVVTSTTGGFVYVTFPVAFLNANYRCVAWNGDYTTVPNVLFTVETTSTTASQIPFSARNPATGSTYNSTTFRVNYMAQGRWK